MNQFVMLHSNLANSKIWYEGIKLFTSLKSGISYFTHSNLSSKLGGVITVFSNVMIPQLLNTKSIDN